MKWLLNKRLAGLEIGTRVLKLAVIERAKTNWRLVHGDSTALPEGTIKPAFKSPNVVQPEHFGNAIKRLLEGYPGTISNAGLSLPSEIIRTLIRGYPKLPDSRPETAKLINWSLEKSFHFPIENTCVSYHPLGRDASGSENLLVTIGIKNVIQQFEVLLAGRAIDTQVVRPASINLYNFFSSRLPQQGTYAFLGLFDNYFCFLVFKDTRLMFFHGVKRGFADLQFFQDVDLTIQHYLETNPGNRIEQLFIGSQVGYHDELLEVLGNLIEIKVTVLKEHNLIASPFDPHQPLERLKLSSFASCIGAAQSLVKA